MCNGIKSKAPKHEKVPLGADAPALRSLASTCNVIYADKNMIRDSLGKPCAN